MRFLIRNRHAKDFFKSFREQGGQRKQSRERERPTESAQWICTKTLTLVVTVNDEITLWTFCKSCTKRCDVANTRQFMRMGETHVSASRGGVYLNFPTRCDCENIGYSLRMACIIIE